MKKETKKKKRIETIIIDNTTKIKIDSIPIKEAIKNIEEYVKNNNIELKDIENTVLLLQNTYKNGKEKISINELKQAISKDNEKLKKKQLKKHNSKSHILKNIDLNVKISYEELYNVINSIIMSKSITNTKRSFRIISEYIHEELINLNTNENYRNDLITHLLKSNINKSLEKDRNNGIKR